MRRVLLAVAGLAGAALLFVVLRPGDGDEAAPPPSTTREAVATTEQTATAPAPAQTNPAPTRPTASAVTVRGGEVVGGLKRIEVERGDRVRLIVRADVSDQVHVHGYDLIRDVGPGAPAQFAFPADVPGRFEIELEDRHLQIAELEVRP